MNWLRRHRRSPWYVRSVAVLICLGVFAAAVFLWRGSWLERFELRAYDLLVSRQDKDLSHASDVVVIGMNDDDIDSLGYPIPDEKMADLLRRVLEANPRAVGVDIFRDVPVPRPGGAQRERMLELLKDRRVFSVFRFKENGELIGVTPGVSPSQMGYAEFPLDRDGRVRRAQLFFVDRDGKQRRGLGVRLATRYLESVDPNLKLSRIEGKGDEWFALGKAAYRALSPDAGGYVNTAMPGDQILFDFRGPAGFAPVPVSDVLSGRAKPETFAGKVVIIGMAAITVKDLISTGQVTEQPGPVVHALLVEQLIRAAQDGRGPPKAWPEWAETVWTLGWTLLGGMLALVIRKPVRVAVAVAVSMVALVFIVVGAFAGGLWLPVVPGLLGSIGAAGLVTTYLFHHERTERGMLNELFNRIVDEDVARTIWARRDELLDHGQLAARELRATVLFTDLAGFTSITEAMDKTCLMRFLNDYMTVMSDAVGHKPDAFVNKYIGDAIMAVFGPPLERDEAQARIDARNAVDCALEMRAKLALDRERWERECSDGIRKKLEAGETPGAVPPWAAAVRPPEVSVSMRIGIQSGMVTAGSLGSSRRMEYTVIGDTVNTAARLESFDKDLMAPDLAAGGCRILIGQDTLDLLPAGEYLTREVGSIQLKGKQQRVTVHGVIGRATAAAAALPTHAGPVEVQV